MNPYSQENKDFYSINLKGRLLDFKKCRVMGILNITPDSFYAGSRIKDLHILTEKAGLMLEQGADLLDVGAYSSRPGAEHISETEEMKRAIPAIEQILKSYPQALISIDTFRASVAREAVNAGAVMINDISGGELDENMFETVADLQVPYCMMHMRGNPQTMRDLTHYDDLLSEIFSYFEKKIYRLVQEYKVKDILLDPGFGFAKTREQNFYLLNHLDAFHLFGLPILVGLSRKSMVFKSLGISPDEALNGSTVLHTIALQKGIHIVRVHDVKEAQEARKILEIYNQHVFL